MGADRAEGFVGVGRDREAGSVEGGEVGCHVVDEHVAGLLHRGCEGCGAGGGGGLRGLVGADAVGGAGEGDGFGLQDGVVVLVFVVFFVVRVLVLRLVVARQPGQLHHHELVLPLAALGGLCAGDGVDGGGVALPVVAELVADNVEAEAWPGGFQGVQHLVRAQVGRKRLVGVQFVSAGDEGLLVHFHSTALCLLGFPLFVWSAVHTGLQDLVFALEFIFKLVFEVLAVRSGGVCDGPLAGLESLRRGLLIVLCRALRHVVRVCICV